MKIRVFARSFLWNGALRINIHEHGVELVDLQALKLGRAELLESLQDLGAGGDESGGGSSRKPLPSSISVFFLQLATTPHLSTFPPFFAAFGSSQ